MKDIQFGSESSFDSLSDENKKIAVLMATLY